MDETFMNYENDSDNDDDVDWVELLLENFDDNLPELKNLDVSSNDSYQYMTDGLNPKYNSQNIENDENHYSNYKPFIDRLYIRRTEEPEFPALSSETQKSQTFLSKNPSINMNSIRSYINYPLKTKILSNYNATLSFYNSNQINTKQVVSATLRNLMVYLDSQPRLIYTKNVILDSTGYVKESFHYITDRSSSITKKYLNSTLTADNPDVQHMNRLSQDNNWETLPLRCSLASLTWSQLQLVTNDFLQSNNHNIHSVFNSAHTTNSSVHQCIGNPSHMNSEEDILVSHRAFHHQHSSAMYKYLLTLKTSSHPLLQSETINPSTATSSSSSSSSSPWSFLTLPLIQLHSVMSSYTKTAYQSIQNQINLSYTNNIISNSNNNNSTSTNNESKNDFITDGDNNYDSDTNSEQWIDENSSEPITNTTATATDASPITDQWWLAEKAQSGDIEAQYALSKWFAPPAFEEIQFCRVCGVTFGPRLFRHHCRMCGQSFCNQHTQHRRIVLHLGYMSPVRCCHDCCVKLDCESHYNQLHWRELRVVSYLHHFLTPYTSPVSVDTRVNKALRVVDASISVAKSAVFLSYPAYLLVETVNILRKYGMSGLAGVLMRRDFFYAVETLKRITGVDLVFKMSLHELTACIYYKLAVDRGLRGCDPDGEKDMHDQYLLVQEEEQQEADFNNKKNNDNDDGNSHGSTNDNCSNSNINNDNTNNDRSKIDSNCSNNSNIEGNHNNSNNSNSNNFDSNSNKTFTTRKGLKGRELSHELNEAIRLVPLALQAVYEESTSECQRVAASQNWVTIYSCLESAAEKSAYALFGSMNSSPSSSSSSSTSNHKKEIVLAIRGTYSIHDLVTDIRAAPHKFPPSETDIQDALDGLYRYKDPESSYGAAQRIHISVSNNNSHSTATSISTSTENKTMSYKNENTSNDTITMNDNDTNDPFREQNDDIPSFYLNVDSFNPNHEITTSSTSSSSSSVFSEIDMNNTQQSKQSIISSDNILTKEIETETATAETVREIPLENDDFIPITMSQWEWTIDMTNETYACRGMAVSALWLLTQIAPSLITLSQQGYDIILTGHSLGAGVAALLIEMLKIKIPKIRGVLFGCPNCVDMKTADRLKEHIISIILHDDFISRVTPKTIRLLMNDLFIFRSQVFRHVKQDWNDVIQRAATLWSPRWRESHSINPMKNISVANHDVDFKKSQKHCILNPINTENMTYKMDNTTNDNDNTTNENDKAWYVSDEAIADLWLPGRLIHIYSYRGQYHISEVDRNFPSLRRIEVQGNLFADHSSKEIFDALLEARAVLSSNCQPPEWTAYNAVDRCECCNNNFTWHSTFRGEAQEYRERHNCRNCGKLVCDPCSSRTRPIPRLGLLFPARICETCYFKGEYASIT